MTEASHPVPRGASSLSSSGRFVWLRHEMPADANRPSHWDFMLEGSGALATWAFATILHSDQASDSRTGGAALRLADHRMAYLEFEGPISGGRGDVRRVDSGHFEVAGPANDVEVVVQLRGAVLRGELRLWLPVEAHSAELSPWEWTWRPDTEIAARET